MNLLKAAMLTVTHKMLLTDNYLHFVIGCHIAYKRLVKRVQALCTHSLK